MGCGAEFVIVVKRKSVCVTQLAPRDRKEIVDQVRISRHEKKSLAQGCAAYAGWGLSIKSGLGVPRIFKPRIFSQPSVKPRIF